MNARTSSLARLLDDRGTSSEFAPSVRAQRRSMLIPVAAVGLLVAAWCAWAPLSGAIVAAGVVKAEFNRKTVQHQEGGIVQQILVHDGMRVRRGDPLVVIGDVRSDATLAMLRDQLAAERIRVARTQAELQFADRFEASDPSGQSAEFLARERRLFDARRRTLLEQTGSMRAQIGDSRQRIAALEEQIAATVGAERLAQEEVALNTQLAERGFVQKTRLMTLQRSAADYRSRIGEAKGDAAEARSRVGALLAAIAEARGQYQQRAADELKEAGARARELEERLRAAEDQVQRQTVRAPVDGEVMALRVGATGTAVGPRDPLLDIAPSGENLVIEAFIDPHDIDYVRRDDAADVRLSAFEARETQLLPARVSFVSADTVADKDGKRSWFVAHVEVAAAELARHPHLRLQAGMPAEVYVTTPARSLFEYLARPIGIFAGRALREP
jgi:HlyD family type I secretion membrane fusion protein